MSDVTEILQLRTDADERCIDRLRELHFNGFVFRGTHGWLSAVPYGGPASMALSKEQLAKFAASIGAPVLNYAVNDFAWGFQLALPDHRTTEFIRWLEDMSGSGLPPEQLEVPPLDQTVLSAVVPPARVLRFLGPTMLDLREGLEWKLFAKAMGFPTIGQMNPTYVTDHPDEARSIGGIEVGHRPQSMRGHSSP